jgi:FKBP-type peptidyl-prolyl cis-trans isomerase
MERIMKKYLMPLALVSVVALQACDNQKQQAAAPAADTKAPAATPASASTELKSSEQRLSYGIAYGLGQRMKNDKVPVDAAAFNLGLTDSLANKDSRMTQEEIAKEMQDFQEKAQAEQAAAQAAAGEANTKAAAEYLKANGAKPGVTTTTSGLQYEVMTEGKGPKPTANDTVEVNYRGTLVDGTEFDSSYSRGETVTFGVGQVIPGWTEVLQLMPVGSKWKVAIPADLAYGAGGAGQVIGPNAALVFEIELIGIKEPEKAAEKAAEPAAKAAAKPAKKEG